MKNKEHKKKSAQHEACLCIHYHFPPRGMVAGFRNYHVAKNLKTHFDSVHVITAKQSNILQKDKMDVGMFELSVIPNWDYRIVGNFLEKLFSIKKKKANVQPQKSAGWGRKLLDSFPTNILIGEGGLVYIIIGFWKAMRIMKQQRIGLIYSSYRSYSDHIIAFLIKLFYPSVQWIADFGDLQIDPVLKNVYWQNFQHWCNRKILAKANLVTTVSNGLAQHLKPYHENIFILRNGIEIKNFNNVPKLPYPSESSFFTIAYTGYLYGYRNARPLFQALRRLIDTKKISPKHLKIIYAGNDSLIWKIWAKESQMEDFLETKGLVSQQEARQMQQQAAINVMLSWASPQLSGWLTFKLYEYLAAGKPILSIVNGSQDKELEGVLKKHQIGKVFYCNKDVQAIEHFILKQYELWLQIGEIESRHCDLRAYSWKRMVQRMLEKIGKSNISNPSQDVYS